MQKFIRINERIRSAEVRVIGPNAEQLGVVTIKRAIELAQEAQLDLVEIAPTGKPPVCRIMDYSKFKYDQEKKERRIKRNQKIAQIKEIRFKPHIEENDYQIKLRQAIDFLDKKDKVKLNMFFRGREFMHRELGQRILDRMVRDVAKYGKPEKNPSFEGQIMTVVLSPAADKV